MPHYEISHDAEQDLQEIINYTIDHHGIKQMRSYVAKLEKCAKNLALRRGHFQEIPVEDKIVRVKHCQHHYIFGFDKNNHPFEVIAILHERMDLMERLSHRLV